MIHCLLWLSVSCFPAATDLSLLYINIIFMYLFKDSMYGIKFSWKFNCLILIQCCSKMKLHCWGRHWLYFNIYIYFLYFFGVKIFKFKDNGTNIAAWIQNKQQWVLRLIWADWYCCVCVWFYFLECLARCATGSVWIKAGPLGCTVLELSNIRGWRTYSLTFDTHTHECGYTLFLQSCSPHGF